MDGSPNKYCKKCNIFCTINKFYKSKNYKSYPDGHIDWCKDCMSYYKKSRKVYDIKPIYKVEKGIFTFEFD
jgi:hypothetical protein